jgi:hypothetical protein
VIWSVSDAERWAKCVCYEDTMFIPKCLLNPRNVWLFLANIRGDSSVIFNDVSIRAIHIF